MGRIVLIIILVSLTIFMSACENGDTGDSSGPFRGGNSGLLLSFVDAAPKSTFNQDDNMPVKVLLKNNGEADILGGEAKVKLFGIHHPSYSLSNDFKSTNEDLKGLSEFIEEGGETKVDLGKLKYTPEIPNFHDFSLKAKVCYPYETYAQIMACISSINIEEGYGDLQCSIDGDKINNGDVSSAPVQIDSFTEEFRGSDEIVFHIGIINDGVGEVYKHDMICEDLDDAIKKGDAKDLVYVEVIPEDVICSFPGEESNSGEIRLKESGEKLLNCRMVVEEGESNYEQRIGINLKYKYVDTTSEELRIYEVKS